MYKKGQTNPEKFIPISCMGPKHAPKDTDLIFQPIYMHWSMCMQFKFELCINALKTQLMHKNVQTNPKKSQKFTQHSCCSMLTREKKIESNKRQWILFHRQRWDVPCRNHHACCEKLIPKPAPNGTKFSPWHVDAAP